MKQSRGHRYSPAAEEDWTRRRALTALKVAADLGSRFVPRPRGLVVLLYHRVGTGSGLEVDLPLGLFEDQVAEIAATRAVRTLDTALDELASPVPRAADAVAITFDDGTSDFVDHALPVLARHRMPVTIYVATQFIEESKSFPAEGTPLSWAALEECVASGLVTVGSHTHSHALLDRLPPSEVGAELDRSIGLLRDRLGIDPAHFAYPKAEARSATARAAVTARFRSAAVAGTRPNLYAKTDPHLLARSPIQRSDDMRWFRRKLDGSMSLEDTARRALNRWRYAKAVT